MGLGMSAAQQYRHYGVAAEASDDMVIFQVGDKMTALRPCEAKLWLKCAAREIFRAEIVEFSNQLEATRP